MIINQQYMKRCPYKKKGKFGAKCKFFHPERKIVNSLFRRSAQKLDTYIESLLKKQQKQQFSSLSKAKTISVKSKEISASSRSRFL
jgi:hypothetical protein